uniref:E3 ubiquitin-protein ligase n=1 Tax=Magallana gigas TaxID=29159 RepID=K1Q1B7_MAGGI
MTASSKSVVVWEWMNEYGRWRPYESHIANFIESSHRKNPSVQVNLGKVAPNMGIYSIDFLTMCQIRFGTGTARPVRRQLLADSSPPGKGIIWQWEGDVRGQWNTFDMEVACLLEDHFSNPSTQNTELNLSKTAVKLPYIMDLSKMTQKRIETGRLRMIRRELLAMPYMKCIPSDNSSTGSGSTTAQSNTQSANNGAVNGGSCVKKQRLSGRGQMSSNSLSIHINAGTPPVSHQAASQNAQLFHQAHSQSPSNPPPASGISTVGFIPHANMFHRAANYFPGNIGHSSTRPIHPSVRSGLVGGSYGNFTYHNFNNHQMSGPVVRSGVSAGTQLSTSTGATGGGGGATGFYLPSEDKIPNNVSKMNTHSSGTWAGCEVFENYVSILDNPPDDEDCCICCEKLTHASGYGEGKKDEKVVFKLNRCSHMFHKLCILAMYESTTKNGSVQCPTCKTIYGEKHGNCPDGVMEYLTVPHSLPGNEGHQTKVIIYHISPGIQGPEHPHPGKRFSCRGFPRVCYIPDNDKGRKVLKLLTVAWRRRLTFTIGQSSTTGESDTVTWNEIHHKTESGRNDSGHGYPDDKYLDNVLMELSVQGVTEADLSS